MAREWQLQEATDNLSEIVDEAISEGPQIITIQGERAAVLVSYAEYRKMFLRQKKISEFFRDSPLMGSDIDLTRDKSPLRDDIAL